MPRDARILLLAPQPFYEERGTPIAVKWVAETLAGAGYPVDLLVFPFGRPIEIPGVTIHRASRPPGVHRVGIGFSPQKLLCDAALTAAARRLLRQHRYAVLHACEEAVFPAAPLARRAGAKLVYDMDSSMAGQLMEKWAWLRAVRAPLEGAEAWALRRADLVLPVCQSLANHAARLAPGRPCTVLHDQAIETPALPPDTEDLRATFGITGPLLLYVGNLEHYQGVDLLVDAFARAAPALPDAALVVIGGRDADLARLRARVDAAGLAARVHLTGPRPLNRLSYYLGQADILASPRLRGVNTPMKVYSYLLAGKALLATRIESHTQAVDDTCALLADPDPAAFAAALETLGRDPALRARLGQAARTRAQQRHSPAAYQATLLGAYERMLRS